VVLMGVAQRAAIAAELMAGGLAPDTPVATIHRATTASQDVDRCELRELADHHVRSPAVIVIGPVAALDVTSAPGIDAIVEQLDVVATPPATR
jgi:uroporphyrin-III C-methyltransferase